MPDGRINPDLAAEQASRDWPFGEVLRICLLSYLTDHGKFFQTEEQLSRR